MQADRKPIRIVIIEDQVQYLDGLRDDLERFPGDIDVVAEATNAEEGLRKVLVQAPDVVIVDLELPEEGYPQEEGDIRNGLSLIKKIHEWGQSQPRPPKILVLTVSDQNIFVIHLAYAYGANGYMFKQERLVGKPFLRRLEAIVRDEFKPGTRVQDQLDALGSLTPRQKDVFELLIKKKNDKEIQQQLGIGDGALGVHLKDIYTKLGIRRDGLMRDDRPLDD